MRDFLKRIASKLPGRVQQEMKRLYFASQIGRNRFVTDEEEFNHLQEWVSEGDWVIDVGANIGHYTKRLSDLVGENGRVFAFEPVPHTFELLASNAARFRHSNVTLFNTAVSDTTKMLGMEIPSFATGLQNYYRAHLTSAGSDLYVMCMSIDALALPNKVSFVKVDAEGHDLVVLKGMTEILKSSHPVVVVEDSANDTTSFLESLGYTSRRIDASHNMVFTCNSPNTN